MPHLILYVTAGCNLRCKHCFYWENIENFDPKKELSLEEIRKISKNLGHLHYLSLTGGEPLLRSDLPEIVRAFYENNQLKHLALHTNGFLPEKTEALARQLIKEFPEMIVTFSLSLDQVGEKHDEIRGRKSAFDNLVSTIGLLKPLAVSHHNFDINVNTVFSTYNQEDIFKVHDYIENQLGCYQALCLVRGESKNKDAGQVDLDRYREISDHLEKAETGRRHRFPFALTGKLIDQVIKDLVLRTVKEEKMIIPCLSGKKSLVIYQDGGVYPCELLGKGYGNIREYDYSVKKILATRTAKEINRHIKDRKCHCTFECPLPLNIIYSPQGLYWLFKKYMNYLALRYLPSVRR